MKPKSKAVSDEMRPEYNFGYTKGVRNEALRSILKTKRSRRPTPPRTTRRRSAA